MRRASCDLPAPVGPVSNSGALLAITTRSIRSIRRLNSALRVSMPDLRNDVGLFLIQGESSRQAIVLRQVQVDDPIGADRVLLMSPGRRRATGAACPAE